MKATKLIVMYPEPTYLAAFERRYNDEHVPIANEKLFWKTRYEASLIRSNTSQTLAQFHRVTDVYLPSLSELEGYLNSFGGQVDTQPGYPASERLCS